MIGIDLSDSSRVPQISTLLYTAEPLSANDAIQEQQV